LNKRIVLYLVTAALAGGGVVAQQWLSSAERPAVATTAPAPGNFGAPTLTPTFEGCAYVWAYRDVPALTVSLQEAVKELDPGAQARAEAFGENCVHADGHSEFGAMETDFYVRVPVNSLADEEGMGNWIVRVLAVITQFPPEQVPGGHSGFVEFRFVRSETDYTLIRVPIDRYERAAGGKTGAELFNMFSPTPGVP